MSVSKEEYLKAKKIVDEYKEEVTKSLPHEFTCVSCKSKKIGPIDLSRVRMSKDYIINACWDDGGVFPITFGYGSIHDMSAFYVALCDDCVTDMVEKNVIVDLNDQAKKYRSHFKE